VILLAVVIAIFVAVIRLGEIRDELREQSRLLRGSKPPAAGDAPRYVKLPGGRSVGIRLDDPAESNS